MFMQKSRNSGLEFGLRQTVQLVMADNGALNFAFQLAANLRRASSHLSVMSILKKEKETCTYDLHLDSCICWILLKSSENFSPFEFLAGTLEAGMGMSSDLVLSWESIVGSNINTKDTISCLYNGSGGGGLI
jgi:hypothetical protein